MKRRSLLGLLPTTLVGSWLIVEASLRTAPASAIGGTLPPLDESAPPFRLAGVAPDPSGKGDPVPVTLELGDFSGRWLVLYFYPKDFTTGCTLEARGFQQDLATFHQLQAEVVGISSDSPDRHESFCGAEGLAYPLLSDPDGAMSRAYGSWLAPTALRHTFLIDPRGIVRARWVAVRPLGHSQEVLATLTDLQSAPATASGS